MHILGVKTAGHDTGAAILSAIDGEITCTAIAEARLNQEKASGRFPVLSINYCLSAAAGLASMDDCDIVVVDRLNETLTPRAFYAMIGQSKKRISSTTSTLMPPQRISLVLLRTPPFWWSRGGLVFIEALGRGLLRSTGSDTTRLHIATVKS